MKCPICKHGETASALVTVTLERGGSTVVFRSVAAEVCVNCGEVFHDQETAALLFRQAEEVVNNGAELDIRRFPLAA
ncbi:MAG: type II toxin-antitoxin system MqsA family antitoxin [Anaerolineae bacterium]|nr:type II toxin-antitoxin system MqsA family antitoxin [Anaerolineae bacterium]